MLKKITFFVFWISSQERATMTLEIQMAAEWVPSDDGLATPLFCGQSGPAAVATKISALSGPGRDEHPPARNRRF